MRWGRYTGTGGDSPFAPSLCLLSITDNTFTPSPGVRRSVAGRRALNELRVSVAVTACFPDISAAGHAVVDAGEQGVQFADGGEALVAGALAVAIV